MDNKAQNEKERLTLDGLARYSFKVLLPAIDERFEKVLTPLVFPKAMISSSRKGVITM